MNNKQGIPVLIPWVYDLILWIMSLVVDLFFREVHPRGSWKVPRRGPVMFVAAPHANQFVDPLILMRVLRVEAKRRIANLIAAKSMKRKFIGFMAGAIGSIPVGRALDSTKPGKGKIFLPDPAKDPLLVRGIDTDFKAQAEVGGLLVLPTVNGTAANTEILEILGSEEIRLKREFKGDDALKQLTGAMEIGDRDSLKLEEGFQGTEYKIAPKIDQTKVYDAVFNRLELGGCVCIFPEGGSHDRTELLPLKPGVAIMALGSLAANPDSGLKIVPCGMNYFHAHKFRSRAVVEFGTPIEIPKELVDMYRDGERREATRQLLEIVYQGLVAVTVTSPDYETLMLIQATRRLYKPKGKRLSLPVIVELNRRLVKGYKHYKDDPRIIRLKGDVNAYNKQLWLLGVRDHQVDYAKFSIHKVVFTLIYRLGKLAVLSIGTLPGLVLFAPVFVASKLISIKKSREALAASTVKLQGRDVVATWKLLVAMAFAPLLYTLYTVLLVYWTSKNRVNGHVPEWVPLWSIVVLGYIVFPAATFAALRIGETGMDILKSLKPLVLSLNPTSANTLHKLRETRARLCVEVTDLINTLGPEMFDDFDHARLVADPFKEGAVQEPGSSNSPLFAPQHHQQHHHRRSSSETSTKQLQLQRQASLGLTQRESAGASANAGDTATAAPASPTAQTSFAHGTLPRNESFHNLGSIGLFASRPPSRSRSRSSSQVGLAPTEGGVGGGGVGLRAFSAISSRAGLDEVSRKIRGAMQERGKERSRRRSEGSWDFTTNTTGSGSGVETPGSGVSEEGKKDI